MMKILMKLGIVCILAVQKSVREHSRIVKSNSFTNFDLSFVRILFEE